MRNQTTVQCPEFPHFGAHYPDATCIDGFLWDLDSCETNGDSTVLTNGGDDPCPFCNTEAYIEWAGGNDPDSGVTKEFILERIEMLKQRYGN